MRDITYALRQAATARAAAEALRGSTSTIAIEGLVELLLAPPSAEAALAALTALAGCERPLVHDALLSVLDSPHATVRLVAVQSLHQRAVRDTSAFLRLLASDPSGPVRRAALGALADCPEPDCWHILHACDDPHWRVRHALILILLAWGETPARRQAIEEALASLPAEPRTEGLWAYLRYRWSGQLPSSYRGPVSLSPFAPRKFLSLTPEGLSRSERRPNFCGAKGDRTFAERKATELSRSERRPSRPVHVSEACSYGDEWERSARAWPWWDSDPAVLVRDLKRRSEEDRSLLEAMPLLLGDPDERVRGLAARALRREGEAAHLARALLLLDEPRSQAPASVHQLLTSLDQDRIEEVARDILHQAAPTPGQLGWAVDQVEIVFPAEEETAILTALLRQPAARPTTVRAALARLASRWDHPEAEGWLHLFLRDPDPRVQRDACLGLRCRNQDTWNLNDLLPLLRSPCPSLRVEAVRLMVRGQGPAVVLEECTNDPRSEVRRALAQELVQPGQAGSAALLGKLQADVHPHVRAAALTEAQAAELMDNPDLETSWHVLAVAARQRKVPLWNLAPQPAWHPPPRESSSPPSLHAGKVASPTTRPLGPERWPVAPLGISGHYGLPEAGFVEALEHGVQCFFWEPNYQTLTTCMHRLSSSARRGLRFITGTFAADAQQIRRDAERTLRVLGVEQVALFLLFWVRSWKRITPEVQDVLEQLKMEGKVALTGLSTHSRPLALEAMEVGWNPIMVRHSAAHRGAEEQVFPTAAERGVTLITFNNTCYGRLLQPHGASPAPRAADCYRYSLAQPGVSLCLSAPATLEELRENLAALRDPTLPPERLRHVLAQGASLYEDETVFRRLVRVR
jgi:aryl-alcohol dehydrogenase-like predicted oxidoreductase/HEAT repeat protein